MSNQTDQEEVAPRPWRLVPLAERRSHVPYIADRNGKVVCRAEGNVWIWQDFIGPMIVAAVNEFEWPRSSEVLKP